MQYFIDLNKHRFLIIPAAVLLAFALLAAPAMADDDTTATAQAESTADWDLAADDELHDSEADFIQSILGGDSTDTENTDTEENTDEETAENERLTGTTVVDNTATLTIDSTTAILQGAPVQIDVAPFATEGTTMLPLRFIAQDILGADVEWDNATNLVRVRRGPISITVDLAYGKVYYDGEPYAMPVKPMVKDNRTLVPLRLISELMNCQVQYEPTNKSITIYLPEILKVDPPVAAITYLPAYAGQTIEYWDDSYDPAGYEITEREWQVTNEAGETTTGSSLYWLFYKKQGGDYHITYRVKNSYDIWSDPVEADYHLKVNEAPKITEFSAASTNVDIGETLDITYNYENESWEDIQAISFTYSWTDSKGNVTTKQGLPSAFFIAGKHTVKLKVQDAFGQWSDEAELKFNVSTTVQASEAQYRFMHLKPGEIYLNTAAYNFNGLLHAITDSVTHSDTTLIDSNSPEKVFAPSLLYQDTVSGKTAVHYHHINSSSTAMKFYIIAHNQTDKPVSYTVGKSGFAGPSVDPMQVGYIENQNYLGSTPSGQTVTLAPGQMALLNAAQSGSVSPTCLQSALVDLEISGYLTISIVAMNATDSYHNYQQLAAADAAPPQTRGTYVNSGYDIAVTLTDTPEKIMLGYPDSFSGLIDDYLIPGHDNLTGLATYNKGNYGVVHRITLTATETCGIIVNPRGSIYRGALLWNDEVVPLSRYGQIKTTQEGVIVGTLQAGESATITYITPDGSDSPCLIVSLPIDYWSEF